jgi:hypothetical protein
MKGIFTELGVDVTSENKKDIDKALHKLLGVEYKNCSASWKEIKNRLAKDESGFMKELDGALGKF